MSVIMAPSILAADAAKLGEEIEHVDRAGADWIHIDVMDGHFVPNLTFGPPVTKALRKHSRKFFDVHLMIEKPELSMEQYVDAGADGVTIHAEVSPHLHRSLSLLRARGVKSGVSLNPSTPLSAVTEVLHLCDLVLIMTVNPGFGGQSFIAEMIPKIEQLHQEISTRNLSTHIQVDGGIDPETAGDVTRAGANVLVAGSAIFGNPPYEQAIAAIRGAAEA